MGDRFSFLPSWLVNACIRHGWIFATPDYRLLPETTAHSSVDDCVDAYKWISTSLSEHINVEVDSKSIFVAGSSAGGYLALTVTPLLEQKPKALLLIYGVLDPTIERYRRKGENIFNRPPIDAKAAIEAMEKGPKDVLTGYQVPDPTKDVRANFISAIHQEATYADYIAGVPGLGAAIAEKGADAVPKEHRRLFATAFGLSSNFPPTLLLHGRNDSAVPVANSEVTGQKLRSLGVDVKEEYPDDAEHGFDSRAGNLDVEKADIQEPWQKAMLSAVQFLDHASA